MFLITFKACINSWDVEYVIDHHFSKEHFAVDALLELFDIHSDQTDISRSMFYKIVGKLNWDDCVRFYNELFPGREILGVYRIEDVLWRPTEEETVEKEGE